MTMPFERTRAVILTEQFLKDLSDPAKTPRVPGSIRGRARSLLRHYPMAFDMDQAIANESTVEFPNYSVFGKL
jgi:hypothetical protein